MILFKNLLVGDKFIFEYEFRWCQDFLIPKKEIKRNKYLPILQGYEKTGDKSYKNDFFSVLYDGRINAGSKIPSIRGYILPNTEVILLNEFLQSEIFQAFRRQVSTI